MGDFTRQAFDLTRALWRVIDRIPEDEPLRSHLRERAYGILRLAWQAELGSGQDLAVRTELLRLGIRELDVGLRQAQERKLAEPVNFQVLRREYGRFRTGLGSWRVSFAARVLPLPVGLNPRQKHIVAYLQERGQATLSELLQLFPGKRSPRTFQRDLTLLLQAGVARRLSHKRWARYALNGIEPGLNRADVV